MLVVVVEDRVMDLKIEGVIDSNFLGDDWKA